MRLSSFVLYSFYFIFMLSYILDYEHLWYCS